MIKKCLPIFLSILCLPVVAFAQDASITRRDGFVQIWQSVKRPVGEIHTKGFPDVAKGSAGYDEITYAKQRSLLDDTDGFHPDDPLLLRDAMLWLLRTRNVDDIDLLTAENLPTLLDRFPVVDAGTDLDRALHASELATLIGKTDDVLKNQEHEASLYSEKFQGHGTAFGEKFNMNDLTAAHRTFPHNTLVRVTNVQNGKSVIVRINDRGPFVAGRDMDLSLAAFTTIADRAQGKIQARFERLGDVSLVGDSVRYKSVSAACSTKPLYHRRVARAVLAPGIPTTLPLGDTLMLTSKQSFVVRSVLMPDKTKDDADRWITPGEAYAFMPPVPGDYVFTLADQGGRRRSMRMHVESCIQP